MFNKPLNIMDCRKATLLAVAMACLASLTAGRSLDQLIQRATKLEALDFMSDIEGSAVRQELDMLLSKDQYLALYGEGSTSNGRKRRKATRYEQYRWTEKEVPYSFAQNTFSSKDKATIKRAIEEWSRHTCVTFREVGQRYQGNHVQFVNGGGCSSYVGMQRGRQDVTLAPGCRHVGVVIHELGHALGFHPEQNRPDRDQHVVIQKQHIPDNIEYNFRKYSSDAINTYGVPYDYTSIMHYGSYAFSNTGSKTIVTRDRAMQSVIGNRDGLSFYDVMLANLMYKCSARCSNAAQACPSGGYRAKDCKCYCKSSLQGEIMRECSGNGGGVVGVKTTLAPRATTTTTPEPEPTGCFDANENCPNWAKSAKNYCVTNSWVKNYCKKSCGTCDKKVVKRCMDKKDHLECSFWSKLGFCSRFYVDYMKENCQSTCEFCKAEAIDTSVVATGSSIGQNAKGTGGLSSATSNKYSFVLALIAVANIVFSTYLM